MHACMCKGRFSGPHVYYGVVCVSVIIQHSTYVFVLHYNIIHIFNRHIISLHCINACMYV